jgi:hypothetical protein
MWNERKMPERWYGLLHEPMQVEEQRMRVIKDGGIVDNDYQGRSFSTGRGPRPRIAAGDEASDCHRPCTRASLKHLALSGVQLKITRDEAWRIAELQANNDGQPKPSGFDMKIHPHMLRHSCGYKLANDGIVTVCCSLKIFASI